MDFNHKKDVNLTFSMRVKAIEAVLLNTRSFRSFQRTQTVVNQILLKIKVDDRCMPDILINCVKC